MKLLVITQKVDKNDENLGAFYLWWEMLSRHVEHLTLIASSIGEVNLPSNVTVMSLGKESGRGKLARMWKFLELFSYHYARSDAVLFHQIPEFVLASAPFLLSLKRKSFLWYAHGSVNQKLKWAERLVDFVLTSSDGGFRLPSKKVLYLGQAIDETLFQPAARPFDPGKPLRLITVGRIAPIKDYETLLRGCKVLKGMLKSAFTLSIVGGPILARDHDYLAMLKKLTLELGLEDVIHFRGAQPFSVIPALLQESDIFLNLSRTGSLDKAVLEAMACGLTTITANEAYRSFLPQHYFLDRVSAEFVAARVKLLASEIRPNQALREIVLAQHSLSKTIAKIASLLAE